MRAGTGPYDAEQDEGAAEKDNEDGSEDDGEFDGFGGDCRGNVSRRGHFPEAFWLYLRATVINRG